MEHEPVSQPVYILEAESGKARVLLSRHVPGTIRELLVTPVHDYGVLGGRYCRSAYLVYTDQASRDEREHHIGAGLR